ncbi:MAG: T9SS type A sorting domain-containing protein [Bacteroidetes bacterium]|nr:T9SS type A sorting domain-containing protein [Bacteroidota bacterium]
MIKKLPLIVCVLIGRLAMAQGAFSGTYNFANITTSSGLTDPTPVPTASGVTFGSFSAVGQTASNPNAAGRFSFTRQPLGGAAANGANGSAGYALLTGALSANQYYEVTLTPQAGNSIAIDSIKFTLQRSGTGIRSYALRASTNGFSANLPAAVLSSTSVLSVQSVNEFFVSDDDATSAVNGSAVYPANVSGSLPITVRFYGWNAESNVGTFSIDNVTFYGHIVCPPVHVTPLTICEGSSATLTASGADTYTWNTNDNTPAIIVTPTVNTTYTVSGTTTSLNCVSTSTTQITVIASGNTPTLTVNSASICSGSSATLTVSGADSYTWSNGGQTNSIVVSPTVAATYTVSGELNGCTQTPSATVYVHIFPEPSVSIAAVSNPSVFCVNTSYTLLASGANSYSWSTGALTPSISIKPMSEDNVVYIYTTTGTNSLGCSASAEFTLIAVVCTGVDELKMEHERLKIYPNPVGSVLSVELLVLSSEEIEISVYDILGNTVIQNSTFNIHHSIDVRELKRGIYFIAFTVGKQKAVKKLIVE